MAVISAQNITIDFPIYGGTSRSLKNTILLAATGGRIAKDAAEHVISRALNNVSFDFHEGDRIGLMGHNGSGKTTLLRVLAGIYEPTSGLLEVNGRITSLLSLTLGMDMDATGMENIFMRGHMMGIRPSQMRSLVDDIVEFASLGSYIHLPIRTYSSGMLMRLAFGISTSTEADIILMDEWLSVGDAEFAQKAQERIERVVGNARIVIIASHNINMLKSRCNKLIKLEHGNIVPL